MNTPTTQELILGRVLDRRRALARLGGRAVWLEQMTRDSLTGRMATLGSLAGMVSTFAFGLEDGDNCRNCLEEYLLDLAAAVLYWRECCLLFGDAETVAALVRAERQRQTERFGDNRGVTPTEWAAVLLEEVGEVAEAVCECRWRWKRRRSASYRLEQELVQVCAVAVFWLETLEGQAG